MENEDIMRIEYDDDAFAIIDKVNSLIKDYGISIVPIEGLYDGYELS